MMPWFVLVWFFFFPGSMNRQAHPVTTITLDPAQTYQVWQGFGASGAWWAQHIGGWSDENRQRIIDLLFDPDAGIGLTLYRHNLGGGEQGLIDPWRNSETVEVASGQYDWSRDANALWVLRAAVEAGVQDVVVFANSPTGRMTVSGRAAGNPGGGSNLRPEMHEEFARYLVDVARHLIEVEGLPVRWISPINEPQWDWQPSKGQEGTHYTTDEIVSVLRALQTEIDRSGLELEISAIDAGEWGSAAIYSRRLFDDPVLAEALDHFAVHSYWSDARDKANFVDFMNRHYPGVPLWMSEWTEMQSGRDYGMDSALLLASTIHDDLTIGGVTSWQYWIAVSKYNYRDGLIYTREYGEAIEETQRLWAMGNYSRFIRPGAIRIAVDLTHDVLRASAWLDPETGAVTLVVLNPGTQAQSVAFAGAGLPTGTLAVYETSEVSRLVEVYCGPPTETIQFAPQSVTTVVLGN
jgi:O-glycosyl hydrolase